MTHPAVWTGLAAAEVQEMRTPSGQLKLRSRSSTLKVREFWLYCEEPADWGSPRLAVDTEAALTSPADVDSPPSDCSNRGCQAETCL